MEVFASSLRLNILEKSYSAIMADSKSQSTPTIFIYIFCCSKKKKKKNSNDFYSQFAKDGTVISL